MMTGQNPGLCMALLVEQWHRVGKSNYPRRAWIDAGYCIDAPIVIAAGSFVRDQFGPETDDWLPMESMIERENGDGSTHAA